MTEIGKVRKIERMLSLAINFVKIQFLIGYHPLEISLE